MFTVEPNNISDKEILTGRLPVIHDNTGCTDMYVDVGFHLDDVTKAANSIEIVIHLTNMSGTEPTKKIPVTEFNIDNDNFVHQNICNVYLNADRLGSKIK